MKRCLNFLLVGLIMLVFVSACTNHDIGDPIIANATDSSVFQETQNIAEYTYYQNGDLLQPASASPHGSYKLRFNAVASTVLDGQGELPSGENFPAGSIIVKEVHQNSTLTLLAVMKKAPTDPNAGAGWLWAEYLLDGQALISIEGRGSACTNCHSDTPNRDLVRTFDLH